MITQAMTAIGTTFVANFHRAGWWRWRVITEPRLVADKGPHQFIWAEPLEKLSRGRCYWLRSPRVFYWPLDENARVNGTITEIKLGP